MKLVKNPDLIIKDVGDGPERACTIIQQFWYVCLIACTIFFPARAWPISPSELQTLQLFYENDFFSGTDKYYTNAFQITWLSKDLGRYEDDNRLPEWSVPLIRAIPFSGNPAGVHNVGVIFGHQIYTPSDTQVTTLLENYRPYAGFLYGGLALGNVRTSTSAGGEIRFGYHIPQDFGSDAIRAGAGVSAPVIQGSRSDTTSLGFHIFASSQVEAVLHDIFLDGNTWQDSPGVEKKPLVADLSLGVSFSINMFKLTYRHLFRTEQFDGQKQGHTIGSLTLAVSF